VLRRPVDPKKMDGMIVQMSKVASSSLIVVVGAGAALANPGAFIPIALKTISETNPSPEQYIIDWIFFSIVSVLPLILAIVMLFVAREWTARTLVNVRDWLFRNAMKLAAAIVALLALPLSNLTANDSVTVTARRSAPGFFVRIFGISSVNVTVSARATIESYTTFVSTGNVMPFGVMQANYTLGTSYTIFGDGSSSNNGSISPDITSGSGCTSASGANDLGDTISGDDIACPLSIGQTVETKTGHSTGQVAQGLNDRMSGGWKTFNQIVQPDGNGHYTLLDPTSPQLVVIPVVLDTNGGTTWPSGHSSVRIVGFAWFVITGCGNPTKPGPCSNSDGKWVNGTFVDLINANTSGTTGAWNPSTNSASTIELTA